jgi:glycosyltransferase involved in cell wall biosynthesis
VEDAILIVPCFDEAARLDGERFLQLARAPGLRLLFVDDGSSDGTPARLADLRARADGAIDVLTLARNEGKAEAVRRGLLRALELGAPLVGYADADLSTPPEELLRLLAEARRTGLAAVLGSRVALLGTDIRRSALRHYLGRVFATFASLVLRLRVYDTQCGAKLFRASPPLRAALQDPFRSRWAFDVEILGRLLAAGLREADFIEIPLQKWADVGGSKLTLVQMLRAALDLWRIGRDLARRRR